MEAHADSRGKENEQAVLARPLKTNFSLLLLWRKILDALWQRVWLYYVCEWINRKRVIPRCCYCFCLSFSIAISSLRSAFLFKSLYALLFPCWRSRTFQYLTFSTSPHSFYTIFWLMLFFFYSVVRQFSIKLSQEKDTTKYLGSSKE